MPPKRVAQQDASKYKKVATIPHVRDRPGMYIGSVNHVERKDWHLVDGKATLIKTTVPYALCHIVKEVVSNVGDNADRSRKAGIDPGECTFTVEGNKITITNEGLCIPIEKDSESGLWIPEMIFSKMRAGSNFGAERDVGGANGIGTTAAAIFSTQYGIEIRNPVSKKVYTQEWSNNLSVRHPEVIRDYYGENSLIKVWYIVDHKRMGYKEDIFVYPESAVQIFRWICASLSFTANIPVVFNGERMHLSCAGYAELHVRPECGRFVVERENLKIIYIDTPRAGKQVGFVNYVYNPMNGEHVSAALTALKNLIMPENKSDSVEITTAQIKPNVTVIISITGVVDADWGGGQTKLCFGGPMSPVMLPTTADIMKGWDVADLLDSYARAKVYKDLGKVEKKQKKGARIRPQKGEDANWAGTDKSHLCTLFPVEGDSAEGYFAMLCSVIPGGRNTSGVVVLQGKPPNVCKGDGEAKILNSPELKEISRRLKLDSTLDYATAKARKTLRYGKLCFLADADVDGAHIKCLLLAFLNKVYPTLLQTSSIVVDYITPRSRATKGNSEVKFYFEQQETEWLLNNDSTGWSFKYYKGLGNSNKDDVRRDYIDRKELAFVYDRYAGDRINLAMDGRDDENVGMRKSWITGYSPDKFVVPHGNSITITQFVDNPVREYCYESLSRGIHGSDGLNNIMRKILCGEFNEWGRGCTSKREMELRDFAGSVSKLTKYHHGEASLFKAIINMAQTHVGSNNIPLLKGVGRFGTIYKGGKHAAAPRYLCVLPSEEAAYIYLAVDDPILERNYDGDKPVEPRKYLPIIPMYLVNGVKAVCVGWTSKIPCHHPLEIIDQYIDHLEYDAPFTNLEPWYRGYTGDVYMDGDVMVSRGRAVMTSKDSYEVTCLPVRMWGVKYYEHLEKELFVFETIEGYDNLSTDDEIRFTVRGVKLKPEEKLTEQSIRVITREVISNLTIIGPTGMPVTYPDTATAMQAFFDERMPWYDVRKQHMIETNSIELNKLRERRAYILAFMQKLFVFSDSRDATIREIQRLKLNVGFYVKTSGYTLVKPYELNQQGLDEVDAAIAAARINVDRISSVSTTDMWLSDLRELRAKLVAGGIEERTFEL